MAGRIQNKNVAKLLVDLAVQKIDSYNDKSKEIPLFIDNNDKTVNVPLYYFYSNKNTKNIIKTTSNVIELNESFSLREYQHAISNQCIDLLKKQHTLMLNVRCGWGKTPFGIYIASKMNIKRMLVLEDNQTIEEGWTRTISAICSAKVVVMKNGIDYSHNEDTNIFIASVDTFCNIKHEFIPNNIEMVFVDEVKCFCTEKRIKQLLRCECNYLVGASADIQRNDGMHKALELFYGPADTYISQIWDKEFDYVRIHTDLKPKVEYNSVGWGKNARRSLNWDIVLKSCSEHANFNKFIIELVFLFQNAKTLIMSKSKIQVNLIYKTLLEGRIDVAKLSGKGKNHLDAAVVVATIKKGYKGYDVASVSTCWDGRHYELVIIVSDMEEVEQAFGRGFRVERPCIIDFIHSLPKLYQHANTRKQWCEKRKAIIHNHHIML